MIEQLKRVRDFLEDDLLLRVTFFNMGTLISAVPTAAFVSGLAVEVNNTVEPSAHPSPRPVEG